MGVDDSNQTFLWRLTKARVDMQNNASMGVEATQQLQAFGQAFQRRMQEVSRGVDMNSVEARSFKAAFEELQDEFEAFMALVPISGPSELVELLKQSGDLMKKIESLPARRKKPPPPPQKEMIPPDASIGQMTQQVTA